MGLKIFQNGKTVRKDTSICDGWEQCPDVEEICDDFDEDAQALTEREIEEIRVKSYWKGYEQGYCTCKDEFLEGDVDALGLKGEQLNAWRAGYRQCKLNNVDIDTLTINPMFLEYVYKIKNLVLDLREKRYDEDFMMKLYDINKELSEMTQCMVMDMVYKYWEYK